MKLYMTVLGEYDPKRLSIQLIEFDNRNLDKSKPKIAIYCNKKYEDYFVWRSREVKFHDRYGRLAFVARNCYLNFRCYECDYWWYPHRGIQLVATELEVPKYGNVSKEYLQKILRNTCNAKLKKYVPTSREIRAEEKRIALAKERDKAYKQALKRRQLRSREASIKWQYYCDWYKHYFLNVKIIIKGYLKLAWRTLDLADVAPQGKPP